MTKQDLSFCMVIALLCASVSLLCLAIWLFVNHNDPRRRIFFMVSGSMSLISFIVLTRSWMSVGASRISESQITVPLLLTLAASALIGMGSKGLLRRPHNRKF